MRRRPWPIVLLALFQLLSPWVSIALSFGLGQGMVLPPKLIPFLVHLPWYERIDILVLPWVTALCIYICNPLSYAVFLLSNVPTLLHNAYLGWCFPQVYPLWSVLFVNFLNLGLVSYLIIPAVRAPYLNAKLRWWETKARYRIDAPCRISVGPELSREGQLRNISEGGMLWECADAIPVAPGEIVQVAFGLEKHEFKVEGRVIYCTPQTASSRLGLQFVALPKSTKKTLKRKCRTLKGRQVPSTKDGPTAWQDLWTWTRQSLGRPNGRHSP